MTDRELLEAAAKAAGFLVHKQNQASRDACGAGDVGLWISKESTCWNPLSDDGDALRLAVKLGLDVFSRPAQWGECGRIGMQGVREWYDGDPLAATRRSIVRAAAEIGQKQ